MPQLSVVADTNTAQRRRVDATPDEHVRAMHGAVAAMAAGTVGWLVLLLL